MTKHHSNADTMTAWQTPVGQLPLDVADMTEQEIRDAGNNNPETLGSETIADALGLPRGPYENPLAPGDVACARARVAAVIARDKTLASGD